MYTAPLSVMKLMIQTKSVKYMPFTLSLACFLNGVCWTTYSFLPFNINILVRPRSLVSSTRLTWRGNKTLPRVTENGASLLPCCRLRINLIVIIPGERR
ncbi:hypothetical protein Cni_G22891 [Canna indica]|uniref:Uncharacterized protein n=1 Tax=Canna indica TaxID=4628 RepID=A0AAQ3KXI5_9LILI|nr:hypothetical protein Cni_G22891 [Canna indica]